MKLTKTLIIASFFILGAQACQSKKIASDQIEISGIIQKQGITTYQYGTHIINSNDKQYALKSSTIDLDNYLDRNVSIIGEKIAGYPIEGGPDYLEVVKIK
jgi:hypothetical protein